MADALRTWISPVSPGPSTASGLEIDDPQRDAVGGRPAESSRHAIGIADRVGGDHRHLARAVGRQPAHARARA